MIDVDGPLLVEAAERICWLTELISSHDVAEDDGERSDLVAANPDLGRFLAAAECASEWDRDRVRAEVGASFILEALRRGLVSLRTAAPAGGALSAGAAGVPAEQGGVIGLEGGRARQRASWGLSRGRATMGTGIGWRIRWTKDEKARCAFKGDAALDSPPQALFAVGVDAAHGRFENTGVMDAAKASFLWLLAGQLNGGKPLGEAIAAARAGMTDLGRERLDADTAGAAVGGTDEASRSGPPRIETALVGDGGEEER
jgi:hypothetical protein